MLDPGVWIVRALEFIGWMPPDLDSAASAA
jgi:hypothetical protein